MIVSTHFWRRTARAALHTYEGWQAIADGDSPPLGMQAEATRKIAALGLTAMTPLTVKRCASARRGRWEVTTV
jgi:hypothetical protein